MGIYAGSAKLRANRSVHGYGANPRRVKTARGYEYTLVILILKALTVTFGSVSSAF